MPYNNTPQVAHPVYVQIRLLLSEQYPDSLLDKYDAGFIQKAILRRMECLNCIDATEYLGILARNKTEGEALISSLQVSYSEFFRNPLTFAVLENILLPTLIHTRRDSMQKEIRVWSAACAGGQEAYSLAILLEEIMSGINKDVNYRIFATDQNEWQVKHAQKGHFEKSSMNGLTLKRIDHWFDKEPNRYSAKAVLKSKINFSVFDLFDEKLSCPTDSIFGDFDVVFCANLLFYYKTHYRETILRKVKKCVATGGYLITGEVEREILIGYGYKEVFPQSAIFTSKNKQ